MAFMWVQQWVALPVIVEEQRQMGDVSGDMGSPPVDHPSARLRHEESRSSGNGSIPNHTIDPRVSGQTGPFHSQYSTIPQLQQQPHDAFKQQLVQGQVPYTVQHGVGHGSSTSSFNMGAIAGALPDYSNLAPGQQQHQQNHQNQRMLSGASTPAVVYQLQQIAQFPNQGAYAASPSAPFGSSQYGAGYLPGQIPQSPYGNYSPTAQRFSSANALQQPYQQPNPYYFYTQGQNAQQAFAQQMSSQYGAYDRRMSLSPAHGQQAGFFGGTPQHGRMMGNGIHNDGLHFGVSGADPTQGEFCSSYAFRSPLLN